MKLTVQPRKDREIGTPPTDTAFIARMEGEPDEIAIPLLDEELYTTNQTALLKGDTATAVDSSSWHSKVRFVPVRIVEIVVEEL